MKQHIKTVKEYNEWRRGAEHKDGVCEALDEVVKAAERYELVRTLAPGPYKELWMRAFYGEGTFDNLVDKMIEARK